MQVSATRNRDWARHFSQYCRAIAPLATPAFEIARDIFHEISTTRSSLQAEESIDALIKTK